MILPLLVVTMAGAALLGASQIVSAQSGTTPFSGLAEMIAQKFGIDQTQVQSVLDQYRQQQMQDRKNKMQQLLNNKLDQEVTAGKITAGQKQGILDELTQLKNKYGPTAGQSLTLQQRQQNFQNLQSDIKAWATSQGIDPTLLPMGWGRMGMKKMPSQ